MSIDQRPSLNIKDVGDKIVQRNFQNLRDYFTQQGQLLDFQFYEVIFTGAETNRKVTHSLGLVPKDVLVSRITGDGTVTFNFGLFTKNEIYLTATGACRVRFFVGGVGDQTDAATTQTDSMSVAASQSAAAATTTTTSTFNIDSYLPVGSLIPVPGFVTTLPDTLMWAEGAQVSIRSYPLLAAALWDSSTSKWFAGGTATGLGDTDPTHYINLPDMRGCYIQGWDSTRGLDPDAAARTAQFTGGNTGNRPGSFQEHGFQDHVHQFTTNNAPALNFSIGSRPPRTQDTGGISITTGGTTGGYNARSNTRPNNVNWRFAIRVK